MSLKVNCTCKYKCLRLPSGCALVCQKTYQRHCKRDKEGKLCAAKLIVDRGPLNAVASTSYAKDSGHAGGEGVGMSRQTQWRDKQVVLYRSLTGTQVMMSVRKHHVFGGVLGHVIDY